MKIAIIGGGNIGMALLSMLSDSDEELILFTSKKIAIPLFCCDFENKISKRLTHYSITNDAKKALCNAKIILCTYPAHVRKKFIENYGNFIESGSFLGFIPGYGGSEYLCKSLIQNGVIVFGLQRVPCVARSQMTNTKVISNILSRKKTIYVASIPSSYGEKISKRLEELLNIKCVVLKEYLSVTLGTSNPLLHTVGVYNIFKNSTPDSVFSKEIKLYEAWNDSASELLLAYDREVKSICNSLAKPPFNFKYITDEVVDLATYYESSSATLLTKKLKSIPSFSNVMAPLKKSGVGYIPNLQSRMFREDFPFGVCLIKEFALLAKVQTPTVDLLLEFYKKFAGFSYYNSDNTKGKDYFLTGAPMANGIRSNSELIKFYKM